MPGIGEKLWIPKVKFPHPSGFLKKKMVVKQTSFSALFWDGSGQIIATSAEVTPNGGLVRESSHNPLNSGLGIIVICPDGC